MIDRINIILKAKNLTAKQFAEEIGVQPSGMSHILSGRNNPSLDFVMKVMRRYPEIDINWLMSGKGEMYVLNSMYTSAEPLQPVRDERPLPRSAAGDAPSSASRVGGGQRSEQRSDVPATRQSSRKNASISDGGLTLFDNIDEEGNEMPETSVAADNSAKETVPVIEQHQVSPPVPSTPFEAMPSEVMSPMPRYSETLDSGTVYGSSVAFEDKKTFQEDMQAVSRNLTSSTDEEKQVSGVSGSNACEGAKNANSGSAELIQRAHNVKKIVKVVVLYDDHTFSEYYPE